ncbi:MAG TPA: SPOR domain-containing protein [Burkholderiales bacterium]|nr:SPOR domain-containing protein [Burkholderiales bacterium]
MARPISDEELQLKRRARRRLIGAIVLVTAIVVALPMVLDSEPKPISGEVSIKIPTPNSDTFTSRVMPVAPGEESKSKPPARASTESKSPPKAPAATTEKKAAAPAPTTSPAAAAAPAKSVPPAAAEAPARTAQASGTAPAAADSPSQTFAVQVVALADAERVKQVQEQVAAAGIKSYTEVVKTVKGDVTRVRAGPYPTRAAAEKARDQLKAIGLSGNVVPQ